MLISKFILVLIPLPPPKIPPVNVEPERLIKPFPLLPSILTILLYKFKGYKNGIKN